MLTNTTTIADALVMLATARVTRVQLLDWLLTTPFDLSTAAPLVGEFAVEFGAIVKAQTDMREAKHAADLAAVKLAKQTAVHWKVGKRGGISVYGLNGHDKPVTLYRDQWLRLLDAISAPADSPLRVFIESNPTSVFKASDDFKRDKDPAYLDLIKAGAVKHAKYNPGNGLVTVSLSTEKTAA